MPGIVRQVLRDAVACTCPARVCLVPGGGAGDPARAPRGPASACRGTRLRGLRARPVTPLRSGVLCRCHLIPPQAHAPGTNVPPRTGPPARTSRHPQWLVTGASRGAALALAYAQEHPERVTEMIIPAGTMTRPSEIYWLYQGAGRLHPGHGTGSAARSPGTS